MKRAAKILSAFGLIELLASILGLYIFDHIPSPWGAGTLPGGLSDAGSGESAFDAIMLWQVHVITALVGAGLCGTSFLFGGGVLYVASTFETAPTTEPS